ncbi:MAG: exodeoxyribonuclease VII small subunit [Planctomycetota bacterium]
MGKTPPEDMDFERAVGQLETLIERIESGEVGLEEAIGQYERGTKLVQRCRSILDTAERRIEELEVKSGSGKAESGSKEPGGDPPID